MGGWDDHGQHVEQLEWMTSPEKSHPCIADAPPPQRWLDCSMGSADACALQTMGQK